MADARRKEELKKKVDGILEVSSVPSVIKKIVEVIENQHSTRSDLEDAISHDQALAIRVVEISNNAFYGFSGRIKSIHGAIAVIGFDLTKTLAVSSAVFGNVSPALTPEISKLWIHSFSVAETAARIAEISGFGSRAVSFTAGLLHDVGRPLFIQLFGEDYLLATKASGEKELIELEEAAFGAVHTEVGQWFAEKCDLPEEIVNTIRYHHSPELHGPDSPGAKGSYHNHIVYLADLIVMRGQGVPDCHCVISPKHNAIMKGLRMDSHRLKDLQDEVKGIQEEAARYLH